MTHVEISRMAVKAGLAEYIWIGFSKPELDALQRYAILVAAAERERIAKLFDGPVWAYDYREIAALIRAGGSSV